MLGSPLRIAAVALLLPLAAISLAPGCGQTCEEQGGFVVIGPDGEEICEAKCEPSLCVEGNTCVNNRCMLVCDAHTDCFHIASGASLTQACLPMASDSATGLNDGPVVDVCQPTPKLASIGIPCGDDDACAAHLACPDGTDCALGGCDPAVCKPLSCRASGGEGSPSYCTTLDCQANADCAPGMQCATVRVPGEATDCMTPKGPVDKGDGEPVIPCAEIAAYNAANGTTYQEGPDSLLRNVCVTPSSCSACTSSVDCSLTEGLACVSIGGETACAATCAGDADCAFDYTCAPPGSPAEGRCIPRSPSCKPPPDSPFCYSCSTDRDCGPAGSTWACIDAGGAMACFDLAFTDTCTTDEDCPLAPSGLRGECLDEEDGVPSSDPNLYHRCYLPSVGTPAVSRCWP